MPGVDLSAQLGHLARRLQQANTSLWTALVSEQTTSPQFAVLNAISATENADQRTVGDMIGLDRSTTAEIVTRLADRGLLRRIRDPRDGRRNLLRLTDDGLAAHQGLAGRAARMNKVFLAPLDAGEQKALLDLMWRVVTAADDLKPLSAKRAFVSLPLVQDSGPGDSPWVKARAPGKLDESRRAQGVFPE